MRFTRPGARPRHWPAIRLDSTQLRGGVLGARVENEGAGADLGPCEVLQFVLASVGRIELDVEVVVTAATSRRFLVHRHDVRKGTLEKAAVLLQQALESAGEGRIVVRIQVRETASMADGREVHLVRPARK